MRREYAWWRAHGATQVTFVTDAPPGAVDAHVRQIEAALAAVRG